MLWVADPKLEALINPVLHSEVLGGAVTPHACQSTPEYSLEGITQSFWPPGQKRETGNHLPGKCYWGRHVKRSRYVPVATWLLFYGSQVREVQRLCVDFGGKSGVLLVIPQPSRGSLRYRGSQRGWPEEVDDVMDTYERSHQTTLKVATSCGV